MFMLPWFAQESCKKHKIPIEYPKIFDQRCSSEGICIHRNPGNQLRAVLFQKYSTQLPCIAMLEQADQLFHHKCIHRLDHFPIDLIDHLILVILESEVIWRFHVIVELQTSILSDTQDECCASYSEKELLRISPWLKKSEPYSYRGSFPKIFSSTLSKHIHCIR